MKIIQVKDNQEAGIKASEILIQKINAKPNIVLGLATGSSPITTYQNLIKANQEKKVSFKDVISFNLDEYKGLEPNHNQSYRYFMNQNLFNHVDIDKNNTHVPSGIETSNPGGYDQEIQQAGGIDVQLLGLGINGHVGFNEPGTSFDSMTHIVDLTKSTIEANARFFDSIDQVPTQAVSMGLKSIMQAKEIILIATGANKAEAVFHLVKGEVSEQWPCSILQKHSKVTIIIDDLAANKLK